MKKLSFFILWCGVAVVSLPCGETAIDTLHFSTGMKYYGEKQYDSAVEEFREMLTLYPDHAPSYYRIGLCWRAQGKNALAIYNLKKAVKYEPKNQDNFRELAEAYFANGETEPAMNTLRQCIGMESDPARKAKDEERVRVMLSKYKKPAPPQDTGRAPSKEAALKKDAFDLKTSGRHNETSVDPLMKPILDGYNAGDYGRTLKASQDLLKKKPGHAGAYYYAGLIRYSNQETDKAEVNFKQAFSYPDKGYNAHYYLGLIYEKKGRAREAIREYEQYVKLTSYEPGRNEVKDRISRLLKQPGALSPEKAGKAVAEKGAHDSATAVFERTLTKYPKDESYSFLNSRLGDSAFGRNDNPGALKYYLKALGQETDPQKKVDLYFKTGECYWRQGSNRGIDYFLQAAAADTAVHSQTVMESCFRLGDYYFRLKNLESALKYYKMAVERFPKSEYTAWAQYQIGNIYKADRRYEEAITAYQRLLDSHPDDYWALQAKWKKEDAVWENEYREILK